MLSIVWFLVWGISYQQSAPPESRISTTQLYQRAVEALQSPNPLDAIPLLQRLAGDENSKLAPLAAVRLAECYLANNQSVEALELLMVWTPRTLKLSKQDMAFVLDPELAARASQLTRSALAQLPEGNTSLIEQHIQQRAAKLSQLEPIDGWLLTELARRFSQQQRFLESYETLQRLGSLADPQTVKLREYDLPLSILLESPKPELLERFAASIEVPNQLSASEIVSARMAVAEGYRKLGNLDKSSSTLKRLSELLQSQLNSSNDSTTDTTLWLATVDLRLTENMVLQGQYRDAARIAEDCLLKHANYPEPSLFRLIAARCYIAEIDFEKANAQLNQIANDSASKPTQIAQSFWMLGEICFLQRDYSTAIEHYANVLKIAQQPLWHARALLQTAKCHELLAAPLEAMAAYRAIIDNYPQSDAAPFAQARLAEILPGFAQTASNAEKQNISPIANQSTEINPLTIQR